MPSKRTVQPEKSGILSGVFSILSREFDSFVASATGSSSYGPSTSRLSLEDESEEYDEDSQDVDQDVLPEGWEEPSPPRKRHRDARQGRRALPRPNPRQDAPSRKRPVEPLEEDAIQSDEDIDNSEGSRHSPSPPPPPPRSLKRRPSMTMPGSLFIRSPSLEPAVQARKRDRRQRVRFSSKNIGSPSNRQSSASPRRKDLSTDSPRRRNQLSPSVKSAVERFHDEDADPSLLLPSPKKSPHALGKIQYIDTMRSQSDDSSTYTRKDKGKARALDPSPMEDSETSGFIRMEGKERELVAAREELDRNQRRDEENSEGGSRQAESDRDTDKARIRELEREIQRLKEELMKRPSSNFGVPPPPPPPPPPPLHFPKKNLISISSDADPHNLFASARASLKQAPTPVENPIVPLRKVGVSSMGIAPEKMAAFLNEMKTVRLRKTTERAGASGGNASFSGTTSTTTNSSFTLPPRRQSFSSLQRPQTLDNSISTTSSANRSARPAAASTSSNALIGEKRKRIDDISGPSKRHSGISSADSSFASGSTSSRSLPAGTSIPSSLSRPILPGKQPQITSTNTTASSSRLPPSKFMQPRMNPTPSITSAPTPSLCSDNDIEREETGPYDRPPSTPPVDEGVSVGAGGPSRAFFRFRGNGIPVDASEASRSRSIKDASNIHKHEGDDEDEDEDVEMGEDILSASLQRAPASARPLAPAPIRTPPPQESRADSARRGAGAQKQQQQQQAKPKAKSNVFAKRPPSTPFPNKSPRRPRPPTSSSNRPPRHVVPMPPRRHDEDGDISDGLNHREVSREEADEDPLSLSISSPESMCPPPVPAARQRQASSSGESVAAVRRAVGKAAAKEAKARLETRRMAPQRAKKAPEPKPEPEQEQEEEVNGFEFEYEYEREHEHERGHEHAHEQEPDFELPSSPSVRPKRARSNSRSSVNTSASVSRQPQRQPPPPRSQPQAQPQSQPQRSTSRSQSHSQPSSRASRRLTLDEELRNAVTAFSRDMNQEAMDAAVAAQQHGDGDVGDVGGGGNASHDDRDEAFESGVFTGVGMSKKRGFLAHGGAGGAPVFMGVGYVEGAEEEDDQEEEDRRRDVRRDRSRTRGRYSYEEDGGEDHRETGHASPFDFGPVGHEPEPEPEPEHADEDPGPGDGDDDEYIPSPVRAPAKVKPKPTKANFKSKIPRRR